ncbi:U3 snoRNP protein [Cladochytrium tenue]|nr:U3 snoRNP protein [Cladochytrium tenue]
MWVKTQACRVLGDLFATVDPAAVAARRISPAAAAALLDAGGVAARGVAPAAADDRVAALGRDTRRLLLGTLLSEDLAVQVVKNLVFLGRCLLAAEPDAPPPAAANPGDDAAAVPATKSPLLALYRSISFMARGDVGSLRRPLLRRSAFQWLGAMTSFIPPARCGPFLVPALAVLYRASEDTTIKGNPIVEQLPQLAKEVMDVLHRHAGSDAYLAAYNIVTSAVRATRDERRLKRKIEAVADPAATARRKQRKAEKRKEVGKRNAAEAARRRALGVGGSAYFKKVRTGQPGGGKKDRSVA